MNVISLSRGTFVLPWDGRVLLLDRLEHAHGSEPAILALQAVGASSPVVLGRLDKLVLVEVIDSWTRDVQVDELPVGIWDLHKAPLEDLHDIVSSSRALRGVYQGVSSGSPTAMSGVRIYGVQIHVVYARRIVRALTDAGTPAALTAAKQISGGLERNDTAGPLTPEMRDAILATLQTPVHEGMKTLQRSLSRDQAARRDS